ncbi:hypothetical protein SEA_AUSTINTATIOUS_48 [Streptomyces phage Austintatious]|uniref:Uncharacterized protein n=1 Tax=Streptomyces phage Austintatious TaxID=2500795 RepID=A0A411AXJ1_9CAUD|nr:hypothetical protein HOV10_gp48 [Streptomyces phage Austintatious]QAX92809.1 hypothetical protein SEA_AUSTINTATIOUS_48 [Streptomyces phage Austintatious]
MDLYRPANPRSRGAGHYRRPGTSASYCGRTVEAKPTELRYITGVCQQCAKAEQRDRVAAEQVAADRSIDGPTLAERAGVRYARVGKGRRVHYSNNDDTLCGREVTAYDDLGEKAPELCAPCVRAAEERAYSRALAAASPLAAAAMQLAETVEQADTEARLDHAEEQAAAAFTATTHTVEAVEHAEQVEAGVATVEDAEALYATQVVTEAEADAGTWRGEWIGEQPTDGLFTVERPADQGALFTTTATVEPIVARVSFDPGTLARIKAKADADRKAYRAETDDRIAAEYRTYGAPVPAAVQARINARATEQAPARHAIEGVIVSHNGTTPGTAPKHSTDPDARAALDVLASLRLAEITNHTDVTAEPGDPDHAPAAWGFLIEPRGHGRIALYWIEAGRYTRPDGKPFAVELEIGADKLRKAGWTIEPGDRRHVMAHRPA